MYSVLPKYLDGNITAANIIKFISFYIHDIWDLFIPLALLWPVVYWEL